MPNTTQSAASAVANIHINGEVLSPDGLRELRDLQDGDNEGLDAHTEALIEVTSFLLKISDEIQTNFAPDFLKTCKAINYVRDSILDLPAPVESEVAHG
ncbi:MAG: hypothetical protein WC865_03795 [Bacteroidales bacterium]